MVQHQPSTSSSSNSRYPIHDLCSREDVSSTAIFESVISYPKSLNSYDGNGSTVLDILVANPNASIESIEFLANQVDDEVLQQITQRIDIDQYLWDRATVATTLLELAKKIERHHKIKHRSNIAASSMDVVTGSAGVTAAIAAPIGLVAAAPVVLPVAASVALGFGICSVVTRVSSVVVQHCDTKKINRKIQGTNDTIRSLRIQDTILNVLFRREYNKVQQIRTICNDLLRGIEVWDLPTVAKLGFQVGKDYLTALDVIEVMLKRGTLSTLFGGAAIGATTATTSSASVVADTAASSSTASTSSSATGASALVSTTTSTAAATGAIGAFSALWALYNIPIDFDKLQNIPEIVGDLKKAAEHTEQENRALKKWRSNTAPQSAEGGI